MKFFAVHLADLESERFLSASNNQIATWLFLHAFCCKQSNGGIIADAHELGDRFWSRHGIDKDILESPSTLWSWDGSSLTVEPYDIEGQNLYERKTKGGKAGADIRWNRTPNGTPNRTPNAPDQTRPNQTRPHPSASVNEGGSPSPKGGDGDQKKNPLQELVNSIWKNTPPRGRDRSSRKELEAAIKKIPTLGRPRLSEILAALEAWKISESWTKDGGQYIPGIHRWVNDRKWESLPEPATPKQSANINTGRRTSTIEDA